MELLDTSTVIDVPYHKCPYCGAKLTARFEAWTELDDGSWAATEVDLQCESEPDIDSDEWDAWQQHHTYMPYAHWLPVNQAVLEWVKKRYRFKCD